MKDMMKEEGYSGVKVVCPWSRVENWAESGARRNGEVK